MSTHIVVMGYGRLEDGELNWRNVRRLRRALQRVLELLHEGRKIGSVILPTGSEENERTPTMAMVMEREFLEMLTREDVALTGRVRLIVNRDEPEVWGTIKELEWSLNQTRHTDPNPLLEVVTNARHGRRVLLTNKLVVKAPECAIIPSGDTPSKLYHEVLGYGKLLLYMTGAIKLIRLVEKYRRTYYFGG